MNANSTEKTRRFVTRKLTFNSRIPRLFLMMARTPEERDRLERLVWAAIDLTPPTPEEGWAKTLYGPFETEEEAIAEADRLEYEAAHPHPEPETDQCP